MAVAPILTETVYALDGASLGPFATVWPYEAADVLQVQIDTGAGFAAVDPADVTLTAAADPTATGGSVALSNLLLPGGGAWPMGSRLALIRATPNDQPSSFGSGTGFDPAAAEAALDHLARQMQEARAKIGRALALPPGDTALAMPAASIRANKVLGFDAQGAPIATLPSATVDPEQLAAAVAGAVVGAGTIKVADAPSRLAVANAVAGMQVVQLDTGETFTLLALPATTAANWRGAADADLTLAVPSVPTFPASRRNGGKALGSMFVFPEEFGAKGDNATDDTAAILAANAFATANGLHLAFLPRTYKFAGPLVITPGLRGIFGHGAMLEGNLGSTGAAILFQPDAGGNGNFSNCLYDLPSVADYVGYGVKCYGANFVRARIALIANCGNGFGFLCDDTYKTCIDCIIDATVITCPVGSGVNFTIQGGGANRLMQGNYVSGNFINGCKYGVRVNVAVGDLPLLNGTHVRFEAIDGDYLAGTYGLYAPNGVVGPFVVEAFGFFGQFGAQAVLCPGHDNLTLIVGVADCPSYNYFSLQGIGLKYVNTNSHLANRKDQPIAVVTDPTAIAAFNGGVPIPGNRIYLSIPAAQIAGMAAGAVKNLYAFHPVLAGYGGQLAVSPEFSAPLHVEAVQDESLIPGVDGSRLDHLILIRVRAIAAVGGAPGDQLLLLQVGG